MDPYQTYCEMFAAMKCQDGETVRELALNLKDWLSQGGFVPSQVTPRRCEPIWRRCSAARPDRGRNRSSRLLAGIATPVKTSRPKNKRWKRAGPGSSPLSVCRWRITAVCARQVSGKGGDKNRRNTQPAGVIATTPAGFSFCLLSPAALRQDYVRLPPLYDCYKSPLLEGTDPNYTFIFRFTLVRHRPGIHSNAVALACCSAVSSLLLFLMKLAFATPQLRRNCESQLSAERQFGIAAAVELRGVLTALTVATDLHEFLMLYRDSIEGNGNGNFTLRFPAGIRIGLAANHSKPSKIAVGPIDPARVTRIRIDTLEVLDEE